MTLISLALGDKYRQIGLEQKRTHKQMIEMQKNSIVELDQKVSARTADLQQKAQEVRGILNALDSAVFVVQKRDINATEFTVGDTTSATAAKLFGEEALQTDFNPLAALDRMVLPGERDKIAAIASVYHAAIHEDELNFSLNSQLTCAVVRLRSGQVYKLSSAPVVEKGQNIVRGIVLSVTDISEAVARDEAHHHMAAKTEAIEATIAAGRDQAEKLLVQLKLIRNSMLELVGKGDCGIQQTIFSGCQQQLMRDLHTLKGFARTYGFEALSSHIHALESRVQALPAVDNNLQDVHDIAQNFLRKMQIYEWAYFIIHRHETDAVEGKDLIKVFQDMVQQLDSFARARKNVELIADTEGPSVYVSSAEAAIFDRAMIHIVRNSIDHGVAEDGVGHCQVKLRVEESGRRLVYSDNGRGLNLSLILDRAQQSGTSNAYESLSDHDAAMLIFKPGFSTKAKVDDVSGRGVGMDAVRNDMQRLGFHADIRIVNVSQRDGQKMAQVEFIFFKAA
jgi:HPt (histidine-containing phosphotransfer) domain-containing protein